MARRLVDIAKELYEFGTIATGRTNNWGEAPDPWTFAAPKNAPEKKWPLANIRDDLAAVFMAEHGDAPNATALGDAMTVLEGLAK
ncbi:MAG: hypothetical protein ACM3ZF_00815 [Mycobacterium leprae]